MKPNQALIWVLCSVGLFLALAIGAANDPDSHSHDLVRPDGGTWVVVTEDGTEKIEDLTAYCIDCHGTMESKSKNNAPSPTSGVHSHPVDQPYPANGTDLVPLKDIDKRLVLTDDKMTCITCHQHDAPDRRLVIPDAYGKLCISCHQK